MKRERRRHGDFWKFILLALLKKGPLSLEDLEKLTSILVAQFEIVGMEFGTRIVSGLFSKLARPAAVRSSKSKRKRDEPEVNVELECKNLFVKGLITLNEAGKYQLTNKGEEEAEQFAKKMEKTVNLLENHFLSSTAAARNTVIIDIFLTIMKLAVGLLSGSIALLAGGADASIDTVSASVVWVGIKLKKELLGTLIIILMMSVTGISLGYESITTIMETLSGRTAFMTMPYSVIGIQGIAIAVAAFLFFYHRFVGKRNGSLALISRSVDSKNDAYVAALGIIGAIFSIFRISYVDALVGAFVTVRILIDSVGLSKDTLSSIKGEETDLSKYRMPFEKQWHLSKLETFRVWILYSIKEERLKTKGEIISSLEKTFKPEYVPVLSEFRFSLGKGFDFNESFNTIMEPLLDEHLLIQKNEELILTDEGRNRVNRMIKNARFRKVYT
jgi:Co/Zn/Cd efflux system component/predicted transcriptional regulator